MQNSFHLLWNIICLLSFLAYSTSYGPTDGKGGILAELRQYNPLASISSYSVEGTEFPGLNRHVLACPVWHPRDANLGHGTH